MWVTCPEDWDNLGKLRLIPDVASEASALATKRISLRDGPASYQLVGEVTAHQGDDQ